MVAQAVAAVLVSAPARAAATTVFTPVADAAIYSGQPDRELRLRRPARGRRLPEDQELPAVRGRRADDGADRGAAAVVGHQRLLERARGPGGDRALGREHRDLQHEAVGRLDEDRRCGVGPGRPVAGVRRERSGDRQRHRRDGPRRRLRATAPTSPPGRTRRSPTGRSSWSRPATPSLRPRLRRPRRPRRARSPSAWSATPATAAAASPSSWPCATT